MRAFKLPQCSLTHQKAFKDFLFRAITAAKMRLLDSICETVTRALGLATYSPWEAPPPIPIQTPLIRGRPVPAPGRANADPHMIMGGEKVLDPVYWGEDFPSREPHVQQDTSDLPDGPIFSPPSGSTGFKCDYSAMKGWKHVGNADTRGAWLEKPISADDATGGIYDVLTDNDRYWPTGIVRKVTSSTLSLNSLP